MEEISYNALVEAKNDYTKQLVSILSPLIYEGFESIFEDALAEFKVREDEKRKYSGNTDSDDDYSELQFFQDLIRKIPKWNQDIIDSETRRIIEKSKCSYLDKLLEAVFVASSKILSMARIKNPKNEVQLTFPTLRNFIHKCYVVCGFEIYQNAYLFDNDDITPIQKQKNVREIFAIIKDGIVESVRRLLPTEEIINNYIKPDDVPEESEPEPKVENAKKELEPEPRSEKLKVPESQETTEMSDMESFQKIPGEDTNLEANCFRQLVKNVEENEKKEEPKKEKESESDSQTGSHSGSDQESEETLIIRQSEDSQTNQETRQETKTEMTQTATEQTVTEQTATEQTINNLGQLTGNENIQLKSLSDFRPPLIEKKVDIEPEKVFEPETKDIFSRTSFRDVETTQSSAITEEDIKRISAVTEDEMRRAKEERKKKKFLRNKDKIRMMNTQNIPEPVMVSIEPRRDRNEPRRDVFFQDGDQYQSEY